jgi:carboxymethylenebutenolidase
VWRYTNFDEDPMVQRTVQITTEDGVCPASLSIPDGSGPWPAVIMFLDGAGMRDTVRQMGERLSTLGYVVLVPDYFYREGVYEPVEMPAAFQNEASRQMLIERMGRYTADMAIRDARTFLDYLDSLAEKKSGSIGTTGYCFGGRLSLIAAASLGSRVAAAASFHGGNLAQDGDPDSPHHKVASLTAAVFVAGAIEDQSFPNEQKDLLEATLTKFNVSHTIETYPAHHGFAVPDHAGYDESAAERHWRATENFLASELGR